MAISPKHSLLLLLGLSWILAGCAVAPLETTKLRPLQKDITKVGKTITVGLIVDNRFPFWPRKESSPPVERQQDGKKVVKNFEPLPVTKEVRVPMGEVRSSLAQSLKSSQCFEQIINPPLTLTGRTLEGMLKKSLETSDYLVVGEVNSFYSKNMGLNWRANITYPLDSTLLALPNAFAVIVSGGRFYILSGGIMAVHTAECVLSMSLTLYSVETGQPITTVRVQEVARCPVDANTIYGEFSNEEDDWIDVGRKLGEVALKNGCNQAVAKFVAAIQRDQKKRGKP